MNRCDILIAGGGLAGLTLATMLAEHPYFRKHSIFILDRAEKRRNDRTWCFWARPDEPLPPIVFFQWPQGLFVDHKGKQPLQMDDYQYYMIRGVDFYDHARRILDQAPNVRWIQAEIQSIDEAGGLVQTDQGVFSGEWVFNSALTKAPATPHPDYTAAQQAPSLHSAAPVGIQLWQHFKGQVIRSEAAAFNPKEATLMDFSIEQADETRFVYVLPFSPHHALIEFTVFSPALCREAEYQQNLDTYIRRHLGIERYEVEEEEFGIIPMSDFSFRQAGHSRTLHIGTAGGFVKGSSGYAFKRTRRRLRALVDQWAATGRPDPAVLVGKKRFKWYDKVLLRVLYSGAAPGRNVFSALFRKLPAWLVFRFLDEDTRFIQELRILQAPPKWPFIKKALGL